MSTTETLERAARELGDEHARNAASWAADGNADPDERRRVLKMLDEGDGQAYDYLPTMPNLSGEFAGDPTPASLFEDVVGRPPELDGLDVESRDGGLIDSLCAAYEDAVSETFGPACEAVLIEHYGAQTCPRCESGDVSHTGPNREGQVWRCHSCEQFFQVL
jgi:hypothetical protein